MSGTIELRRAVTADAAAIRVLTRQAYAKWVALIGREPKPMQADYERAVREHRFDLVYVGDELAALVETIAHPDHLLIENLAVAPAFQGRGLGRMLLKQAEELCVSAGLGEIRLYTNKLFRENVELYLRTGYCIDREESFRGGVTVHMCKRLPA